MLPKYLLIFCQPSDSLLVILSTGPGPPQCLGGPTKRMLSPDVNFKLLSKFTLDPEERLDPAELAATVISCGSPGTFDSCTSVCPEPKLVTTSRDPDPPHLKTVSASPKRWIWKIFISDLH